MVISSLVFTVLSVYILTWEIDKHLNCCSCFRKKKENLYQTYEKHRLAIDAGLLPMDAVPRVDNAEHGGEKKERKDRCERFQRMLKTNCFFYAYFVMVMMNISVLVAFSLYIPDTFFVIHLKLSCDILS